MSNYTPYHVHTDLSLLDSTTKCEDYIKKAVELGQKAIGFSEHGNIYNWTYKKFLCEEYGLKYLHCCEVYLTEQLYFYPNTDELCESLLGSDPKESQDTINKYIEENKQKVRDNYHTILIAKNLDGLKEMNRLISLSTDKDHFYYKPRITFDEFLSLSDNVIIISACLASPLNKSRIDETKRDNP